MGISVDDEFDRQVETLRRLGYPALAGLYEDAFVELLEPLRRVVRERWGASAAVEVTPSRVPFVVVVGPSLVRAEDVAPLMTLASRSDPGVVDRNHDGELAAFTPIKQVELPDAAAYVLFDVERGEEFCGVRPEEALPVILDRGRTPITIHEGIALVTQAPEALEKNKCFMLSASRRGDRRVPAVWISGKAPKLGWCWDGGPHSWLGVASTGDRAAWESSRLEG
jgi:hypothetical protein